MRTGTLLCLALLSSSAAHAQREPLKGVKLTTPPTIDGAIDAEEWKDVPSVEGLYDDITGAVAPEGGTFWLAYDDKYIYFAARLQDTQPGTIRANEYRTNVSLTGDDYVELHVDLSGSLADFSVFGINPRGATSIELAGGRAAKREWQGEFVAKSRVTAAGWEAEARIPWQIMRLTGRREIRFNIVRYLARSQRSYAWVATDAGINRANVGRWTDVAMPKAPVDRSIKLLPYSYLGVDEDEGFIFNSGLDLKTNLADEIAAIGSINPDFRNIENQILSLDFSRFERLAGETRPFFQEGAQYLNSALFASQRISGFDAGLNIHGKLTSATSFGVLNTVDFGEQNAFVANVSHDPSAKDSYRVTAASLREGGLNNDAYLVRYSRQQGPLNLFLRTMGTRDSVVDEGLFNSGYLTFQQKGFFASGGYDLTSPDFRPRLGFAPETDYKGPNLSLGWERPVKWGQVAEARISGSGLDYDRYHGGHYREEVGMDAGVTLRNGMDISAFANRSRFLNVRDRLQGGAIRFPRGNPFRYWRISYVGGEIENEPYDSGAIQAAYKLTSRLQLTGSYQHVRHFDTSDLGIFGFNYDMGRDQSISSRAVKRDEDWNAYVAFRRSGNTGAEYFLILGDPNARTFRSSLILKITMPFQIGG